MRELCGDLARGTRHRCRSDGVVREEGKYHGGENEHFVGSSPQVVAVAVVERCSH